MATVQQMLQAPLSSGNRLCFLLGLLEVAGPQTQDLKGKEQEHRRGSCCPIMSVPGEHQQGCASSTGDGKGEVVLQRKKVSQPLTATKQKDCSCCQRQEVAGG